MTERTVYRVALDRLDLSAALALRDGSLLALADAGVTPPEMARLTARAVRQHLQGETSILVVQWRVATQRHVVVTLDAEQGGRVLAYLEEEGAWSRPQPLFRGRGGRALSYSRIHEILRSYTEPIQRARSHRADPRALAVTAGGGGR